jgi:hypothetical protein
MDVIFGVIVSLYRVRIREELYTVAYYPVRNDLAIFALNCYVDECVRSPGEVRVHHGNAELDHCAAFVIPGDCVEELVFNLRLRIPPFMLTIYNWSNAIIRVERFEDLPPERLIMTRTF